MKIALVAPPLLKVPPKNYGGLEIVVFDLGVALVDMGHEVTLVAPKGSNIPGANLMETVVAPERTDVDWPALETEAGKHYMDKLPEFDCVHDHSWFGLPYLAKKIQKDLVILHTHHGHLDWNATAVPEDIKPINMIGISKFMSENQIKQGFGSRYCYNGVDMGKYEYSAKPREDKLIYVGRISKFKQPHWAIEVALKTRMHLDIVGGSFVDDVGYLNKIKDLCEKNSELVTLHLDASHEDKIRLMQEAKAILVPSAMGEPFGLISVEAMACGTPVIATPDGAIPEVIGPAGYLATTVDDMVKYALRPKLTSSKNCRERAEVFSRENMAKNYLKLYEEAIAGPGW